jgi:hypothetical protein
MGDEILKKIEIFRALTVKNASFQFKRLNSYSNDQNSIQTDQSGAAASLLPIYRPSAPATGGSADGTAQALLPGPAPTRVVPSAPSRH